MKFITFYEDWFINFTHHLIIGPLFQSLIIYMQKEIEIKILTKCSGVWNIFLSSYVTQFWDLTVTFVYLNRKKSKS